MRKIIVLWNNISLVKRIIAGLIIGIILGYFMPQAAKPVAILGSLFVGALKSVAPVLVFFIIMSAISQHKRGQKTNMQSIILLYLLGTFLASLLAVFASLTFPVTLELSEDLKGLYSPPKGVSEVLLQLLMNLVDNPIHAIANANYIGILAWSILLGLALQHGSETVKTVIANFSEALTKIVRWIISAAPFGIMGLVYNTIAENGISALSSYGQLLALLVGCMLFMAFVVNPLIVFVSIRQNPYPLVLRCLKDSGITAFFTRSSAANIPVNMNLCKELGLNKDIYSVSIPLGATINMAGAAITISVLTLSAAHTLHIQVDFGTALMLSLVAAVSACGASGVAGGSLLLIPLACSLFQIPNDIAMKVAGAGFVVGVIQDSCETALNSSTDALFTALSEFTQWKKEGKPIDIPSGKVDPVIVNA